MLPARPAAATRSSAPARPRWPGTSTRPPAPTTNTTDGNNAIARAQLEQQRPVHGRHRDGDRAPGPRLRLPLDQPVVRAGVQPGRVHLAAARNDIDAARANLFAMHNRMHDWSYHLGFTEATWNMQNDNFGRGGLGNDPEQGNAQAGGISGGPPELRGPRQRQPDHPARRAGADHQHVPVAADRGLVLRPVRRRRLRHVGDRPRVHPRDHQPHDRRPERRPQLAAGHERELVGPVGDGVPLRARVRARRARGPSPSASTSPATRSRASATTT